MRMRSGYGRRVEEENGGDEDEDGVWDEGWSEERS